MNKIQRLKEGLFNFLFGLVCIIVLILFGLLLAHTQSPKQNNYSSQPETTEQSSN